MFRKSVFFAFVFIISSTIIILAVMFLWLQFDISENQVLILNITEENAASLDTNCYFSDDIGIVSNSTLEKLKNSKILLSPQEYTQNVVSFYNTLLTFVAIGVAAFGIFLFFHIQNITNDQVQEQVDRLVTEKLRDSVYVHKLIKDNIFGELDDDFVKQEEYDKKIEVYEEKFEEVDSALYGNVKV